LLKKNITLAKFTEIMKKINLLIADDHALVRDGIKAQLEFADFIDRIFESGDGEETLKLALEKKADLILLDLDLPKLNGLQVLEKIKTHHKEIKILIISMHDKPKCIHDSFQKGADGFISKSFSSSELQKQIKNVMAGKKVLCSNTIQSLSEGYDENIACGELTDREKEIIKLISLGKTTNEMAEILFTSEHTVRTHRENINRKLNLHSPVEIALYAIENGLIIINEDFAL
jgi:DNA-binding NarL/FixJ family response regulator